MDFETKRLNKVEEILEFFKIEINKKNKTISKLEKTKHVLKIVHTVSSVLTVGSSTGGIITGSIIIPFIALNSIFTGVTTMISMQFRDCIIKKIDKNREILLLAVKKQLEIFKIYIQDGILNQEEIDDIVAVYNAYFEEKKNIINKYN